MLGPQERGQERLRASSDTVSIVQSTLYCEAEMSIQETGLTLLFLGGEEGEAQ